MDDQALLTALLVAFMLAAAFVTLCYTPLTLRNHHSAGQLAKWLRLAGIVFGLLFAVLKLCHDSIGAWETRHITRIILFCSVSLVHIASVLEATRVYPALNGRVHLLVGVIVLCDTASITLAAVPQEHQTIQALARWLPPSSATFIQLSITALPLWKLKLDKATASAYYWVTVISVFTYLLSVVPFWISVAIPQKSDLALLGCQVVQLVLLNWPPAFSPPMLTQIYRGPEKDRKAFWSRVNWPWKSRALLQDDEVKLTSTLSRTPSSVWTAATVLV